MNSKQSFVPGQGRSALVRAVLGIAVAQALMVPAFAHADEPAAAPIDPTVAPAPVPHKDVILAPPSSIPTGGAVAPGAVVPAPGAVVPAPAVVVPAPAAVPPAPAAMVPAPAAEVPAHASECGGTVPSGFAESVADLGFALLRGASERAGNFGGNQAVSPVGLASLVGLLYAGSAGETARELGTVLEPGSVAGRTLLARLQVLTSQLACSAAHAAPDGGDPVAWTLSNHLWVDASVARSLQGPFLAKVEQTLHAGGDLIDLRHSDEAARKINRWASEATSGRIPSIVTASQVGASAMLATNAVHLRARWKFGFETEATQPQDFHGVGGTHAVPTMQRVAGFGAGSFDGVQVVELPYAGDEYSLVILMPVGNGVNLDALQSELSGERLDRVRASLSTSRVKLWLPKFTVDTPARSLRKDLESMGVRQAWGRKSDFSPMVGNASLALGDVLQAGHVTVNETGTEASAVTAALMVRKQIVAIESVPEIRIDHPFLFALVHRASGTPLFLGRVVQLGNE